MVSGIFAVLVAIQVDRWAVVYAVVLGIVSRGTILWAVITWRLLDAPDAHGEAGGDHHRSAADPVRAADFPSPRSGCCSSCWAWSLIFLAVVADEGADT